MKAGEIANKAAELVGGDRERTHGNKLKNHAAIAAMWNGYLAARARPNDPLDALDVANMMEALKIARRCNGSHNPDDYIDGAGYASVAGEIAAEQERITASWAANASPA